MVDWAESIETRNRVIPKCTDRKHLLDLMLLMLPAVLLCAVLLFHSWVRSRMEALGYAGSGLQGQEARLLEEQRWLQLGEQTLKNPGRIDSIARAELNMELPRSNQLIVSDYPVGEPRSETTLAMASPASGAAGREKP
jgi:cell division protein FtsL